LAIYFAILAPSYTYIADLHRLVMKDGRAAEKLAAETRLLFGDLLNGDFLLRSMTCWEDMP
jgi:hypothetical protein